LKKGTITPTPQDNTQASLAPMLQKEDGALDWRGEAAELANRVRGLTPWPGAYTYYGNERWQIWRAEPEDIGCADAQPGTVLEVTKAAIRIATGRGALLIRELQSASGKRLTVTQYLAGHQIEDGTLLTSEPPDATA
jgi:methionyl-tRNA formyltransferase